MDQDQIDQLADAEAMFVQTAKAVISDGTTVTLQDVTPSTLYFSDRPERVVGHLTTADFVELWDQGDNSFADDPPNAVLAFVEDGADAPTDIVVVINAPTLADGALTYGIDVLEGTVPASGGPVTLFIDPFGRPLSPVSVCGVRRRSRRRARRRF